MEGGGGSGAHGACIKYLYIPITESQTKSTSRERWTVRGQRIAEIPFDFVVSLQLPEHGCKHNFTGVATGVAPKEGRWILGCTIGVLC